MTEIVDIEYLKNYVVNDELYQKCLDENEIEYIERLINIVERKIFLYIDKEQFIQDDLTYLFPDDLKEATRYLVESLFLNKKSGEEMARGRVKGYTEKFDDYSISKEYETGNDSYTPILFLEIPILPDYLNILDRYKPVGPARYGRFLIDTQL